MEIVTIIKIKNKIQCCANVERHKDAYHIRTKIQHVITTYAYMTGTCIRKQVLKEKLHMRQFLKRNSVDIRTT